MKPEILNQMFVISANRKKGTVERLEEKIELFLKACDDGVLPFIRIDAEKYFADWKADSYPAMSHSSIYRENYKPAYRVIEESLALVYETIQQIESGMQLRVPPHPFVVAIDGMSGSGKSTLGELLHLNYPESNLFHMDDYFLQPHQRTTDRLSEVGGNVDYKRFKEEIIDHLGDENGLTYRVYDCCQQRLGTEVSVPWQPLIIIEGVYSQHPYFGDYYQLGIFNKISQKEQKKRILKRNGPEMLEQFETEWIPKENEYFAKFRT